MATERRLNLALVDQMFPPKVAAALRAGESVAPEAFDDVTIFFSDVEGFTKMSTACEPIQIVEFLNELYTVMDHCASLFPVYKVETIGDAYMVVSGLPEPDDDHVANVVRIDVH
jgi:class 3 adenylate cyclase